MPNALPIYLVLQKCVSIVWTVIDEWGIWIIYLRACLQRSRLKYCMAFFFFSFPDCLIALPWLCWQSWSIFCSGQIGTSVFFLLCISLRNHRQTCKKKGNMLPAQWLIFCRKTMGNAQSVFYIRQDLSSVRFKQEIFCQRKLIFFCSFLKLMN